MNAREEILERIRTALKDSPDIPEVPREYRSTSSLDEDALIDLLVDRLVDYKANVFVVGSEDVQARIKELLGNVRSYVVPHGFNSGWLAGIDRQPGNGCVLDSAETPLTVGDLDTIDVVVTGSAAAVAETGTIILDGSADQGRRAITLIPDHHICVVKVSDIAGILPEALRRIDGTRPLTMISGPSATSDIELERVEGVHGPRRLDVIIAR